METVQKVLFALSSKLETINYILLSPFLVRAIHEPPLRE